MPTCKSDDVVPVPESCEWYYICLEGIPIHMTCPIGLLFDPYTKMYEFDENSYML